MTGRLVFFRTICKKMTNLKRKFNCLFHPTTFAEEPQLLSTYPILSPCEVPSHIKDNKKRVIAIQIITYQGFRQKWFHVCTEQLVVRIVDVSLHLTLLFISLNDGKLR